MNWSILLTAIMLQESGGDPNAQGDHGQAIGAYQIHKCVVDDVNRIYDRKYGYTARWNLLLSREICSLYLHHWGKVKDAKTVSDFARIWNGGPRGLEIKSTIKYGKSVETIYKRLTQEAQNEKSLSIIAFDTIRCSIQQELREAQQRQLQQVLRRQEYGWQSRSGSYLRIPFCYRVSPHYAPH